MFVGFAGRVSQEGSVSFLRASEFFERVRAHMHGLSFSGIPDGLIITLDSFPSDGPLVPAVKKARKLRKTLVRDSAHGLRSLPSLHSVGIGLDYAGLVACHTQSSTAAFIVHEIERQAPEVFGRLAGFDAQRFCSELRAVASTMPNTP